jgi:hypothetical protein
MAFRRERRHFAAKADQYVASFSRSVRAQMESATSMRRRPRGQ